MKQPVTGEEWQEAYDLATGLLALDAARQYGLVKGGPMVNVKRCVAIVARCERAGMRPAKDAIERVALAFA